MHDKVLNGDEKFIYNSKSTDLSITDFWKWNSSDLLDNTLRGALAEFIVSSSLGVDTKLSRCDLEPYDIEVRSLKYSGHNVRVEVKCSAYLQSYDRSAESKINYSIRLAHSWNSSDGKYNDDYSRHSDVYVFCLFTSKDRATANPLNLDQWEFYVVPTDRINDICKEQKSISLQSMLKLNPVVCKYDGILNAIKNALSV